MLQEKYPKLFLPLNCLLSIQCPLDSIGGFGGGGIGFLLESARLDDAKCRVKSTHIFGICRTASSMETKFPRDRWLARPAELTRGPAVRRRGGRPRISLSAGSQMLLRRSGASGGSKSAGEATVDSESAAAAAAPSQAGRPLASHAAGTESSESPRLIGHTRAFGYSRPCARWPGPGPGRQGPGRETVTDAHARARPST